jgi:hypothetical protein
MDWGFEGAREKGEGDGVGGWKLLLKMNAFIILVSLL